MIILAKMLAADHSNAFFCMWSARSNGTGLFRMQEVEVTIRPPFAEIKGEKPHLQPLLSNNSLEKKDSCTVTLANIMFHWTIFLSGGPAVESSIAVEDAVENRTLYRVFVSRLF